MTKEKSSQPNKKALREEVAYQLEHTLGKLKEHLGEKKFNSRLKKVIKLLTEDIELPKKTKPAKSISNNKTALGSPVKELKKASVKKAEKNNTLPGQVVTQKDDNGKAATIKPTTKTKK